MGKIGSLNEFFQLVSSKFEVADLMNRLTAPLPISEKNLLRQRKDNLKIAQNVYIHLQRKALAVVGLPDTAMLYVVER